LKIVGRSSGTTVEEARGPLCVPFKLARVATPLAVIAPSSVELTAAVVAAPPRADQSTSATRQAKADTKIVRAEGEVR
jgi:hypothetical protein